MHNDPADRPDNLFGGEITVRRKEATLLAPCGEHGLGEVSTERAPENALGTGISGPIT